MASSSPIPVLGEFVDALRLLQRGHVLVRTGEGSNGCVLDGAIVHHSYDTLHSYGLIDEFDNPQGFQSVRYYRITPRGREFAERVQRQWRSRPLWQRVVARLAA